MSKRFLFPILLWALVCVVGYVVFVARKPVEPNPIPVMLVEEGGVQNTPDGRAISVVPWGHLPGVDRFVLTCLLYTSPSPRDLSTSRMPSSA